MVEDFVLSSHELENNCLGDCLDQLEMSRDWLKLKSPLSLLPSVMEVVFS